MNPKIVLVTGAAGGIGSAICKRFAREGASVVMLYRNNAAGAQALLSELLGGDHLLVQADVANASAIKNAAETVRAKYGKLDVLVNNAGMTRQVAHADLNALDDELIDAIFRTNWRGAFACVRAFQSLLAASGDGLIVNISSVAGQTGLRRSR